jgi:hypothetical protein
MLPLSLVPDVHMVGLVVCLVPLLTWFLWGAPPCVMSFGQLHVKIEVNYKLSKQTLPLAAL